MYLLPDLFVLGKPDIEKLLRPFPAERMDAYVIEKDFLKKREGIRGCWRKGHEKERSGNF